MNHTFCENSDEISCDSALFSVPHRYLLLIHGYATMLMCLVGLILNTLNIAVFSRKNMTSSIYRVLQGIAVADIVMLLEYMLYAYHIYIPLMTHDPNKTVQVLSLWTSPVRMFHFDFWQVFHTISVLLTWVLALWRYLAVVFPTEYQKWCNEKSTFHILVADYLLSPVLCIPTYYMNTPMPTTLDLSCPIGQPTNTTIYPVTMKSKREMKLLLRITFSLHVLLFQIATSATMLIFGMRLIKALQQRRNYRRKLQTNILTSTIEEQIDRRTKMLLVVLLLFLIMEVPQGIFYITSLIWDFQPKCFVVMRLLTELLAIINSSTNFILYYFMNSEFHKTVHILLRHAVFKAGHFLPCRRAINPRMRQTRDRAGNEAGAGAV